MSRPAGVLALLGPTATGKSDLAVAVAERLGGEVISADAFAVHRGFDAGTAKPSPGQRSRVPHHLVDVRDPTEPWSAGDFAAEARRLARGILARGRLPVLCGGTGFYVRTFFEGLFEGPRRDDALRSALGRLAARRGAPHLRRILAILDPAAADRVLPNDASRAIRLLEIALVTGRRPTELFLERPGERWDGPSVRVLLTLPRPGLYGRIERRFRESIEPRLPAEVRGLLAAGVPAEAPAFSAIGYRETAELVSGRIGEAEWRERILRETRRFAKRQETWFRHEAGLVRVEADREDLPDLVVALARPLFSLSL
ncbi:MAG TPA: tRNA (adenosine(37)-N6)-dimethylallyltransferase MiaA [Thermoanaerobaculia bacterium]|nr:tRNA (adenosine(37)-N6)-dimethylallyltransferase MiaA [Thermoanaerobaculia bacterium]